MVAKRRPDEHAMLINGGEALENGDSEYLDESSAPRDAGVNKLDTEKRWRTVKIGEPTQIIKRGEADPPADEVICVFPKGIHLILASNPSKYTAHVLPNVCALLTTTFQMILM